MTPERREERCCLCDQATGRAGKGEDSIYIDLTHANLGPLCPECYADMRTHFEDDTAPIEQVEKELADAGITGVSFAQAGKMLKRIADMKEVCDWAQAVLTAWNIGPLPQECLLHRKLREVMINYRQVKDEQPDAARGEKA